MKGDMLGACICNALFLACSLISVLSFATDPVALSTAIFPTCALSEFLTIGQLDQKAERYTKIV